MKSGINLSIVVCTRNRPRQLIDCLQSLFVLNKDSFFDFEIIIVDQSENKKTKKVIKNLSSTKIHYSKQYAKGKAKALNLAIKRSRGRYLAFTDDDCIVDRHWLRNTYQSFQGNKDIIGVFGQVLPYQPEKHQGKICPCTFEKKKKVVITSLCRHWQNIGFGNNMAFRRDVFEKVGGFKEWLGPGSIGSNAEDAEFALRLLLKRYKILYNPKIVVYHNRWLTKEEFRRQCLSYSCGEVACYGYFAFNGVKLGKKVVKDNFLDSYGKLKQGAKSLILFRKEGFWIIVHALEELFFRLRGLAVAFWFSKKELFGFNS